MKQKKKPSEWTDKELQLIKKHYYDMGPKRIGELIPNHPQCSILAKARFLGLTYKFKPIKWPKNEIEILVKFYPKEGTEITSRLPNRSRDQIKGMAKSLGIKFFRIRESWPKEEDAIVLNFYMEKRSHSSKEARILLQRLKEKGFIKHSLKSVRMRLANFEYLVDGGGLSHAAIQSKEIFKRIDCNM